MIAVELVVAAVLFAAVKFLVVRRCGLVWLLAVCAMVGCSEPREVLRVDELCPSNLEELVSLSATELERACWLDQPQAEQLTIMHVVGMCFGGITLTMFHLGNWRGTCGESLNIIQ